MYNKITKFRIVLNRQRSPSGSATIVLCPKGQLLPLFIFRFLLIKIGRNRGLTFEIRPTLKISRGRLFDFYLGATELASSRDNDRLYSTLNSRLCYFLYFVWAIKLNQSQTRNTKGSRDLRHHNVFVQPAAWNNEGFFQLPSAKL